MKINSQKAIATSRAPRVQIEYDVEVNGENQLVELPFVVGVISNLGSNSPDSLPPIQQRSFVDIDGRNFNQRLKEINPTVNLRVKNHLTGDGLMQLGLTFEEMDDFRPDKLAKQIPALARLLDAREKLSILLTYMDGKMGAEDLMQRVLDDVELLKKLSADESNRLPATSQTSSQTE